MAGLTPPRHGDVIFKGRSQRGRPPYAIAQDGMAMVPQGRRIFRSLSVDYNYRPTKDQNPLRVQSTSTSHNLNASLMIAPGGNVTITPTVGLVRSKFAGAGWSLRSTYGLGTQLSALRGKWVNSLNLSRSQFQQTTALQAQLSSRFQLTGSDAITCMALAPEEAAVPSPGEPGACGAQPGARDPVNVVQGNFWQTWSDVAIDGRGPGLTLERTYSSSASAADGPFGFGWSSTLAMAVQADGASVTTIEGLATDGTLHPLQEAFWAKHGLQCGFCTPGMIFAAHELLRRHPNPTPADIRHGLEGNMCRCTGYQNIVRAVGEAARLMGGRP